MTTTVSRQNEKSAQRDANTAHMAVVRRSQKFPPRRRPLPGAQDGQNLISWRWSLPSPTDPVWWRSMHAISSYRGNRPTNTHSHTHPHTNPQTGPITIHCAAKLSAQCKNIWMGYDPHHRHARAVTSKVKDQLTPPRRQSDARLRVTQQRKLTEAPKLEEVCSY